MASTKATAPAAPVPAPAPALSFSDDAVPTQTRQSKPNPFDAVVKELADSRDKAKSFNVAKADVEKHVRDAQNAGKAHNVTVRNRQEDAGNGAVKVTIWAVDRITRPRKPAEDGAASDSK